MEDKKPLIKQFISNLEYLRNDTGLFDRFILRLIKVFIAVSILVGVIGLLFGWKITPFSAAAALAGLLAAYGFMKNGLRDVASGVILFILVSVLFMNVFLGGGIYDASLFLLPGVMLLSSILLRRRTYVIFLVLVLISFIAATYGSLVIYGNIPDRSSSIGDIVITFIFLLLTIFVINFFTTMLLRLTDAAKEGEEKFKVLTEDIKVGIFAYSQEGKFFYANKQMSRFLGYTREELLAMDYLNFVYPEDREIVADRARRRLEGEYAINGYELRAVCKDGSVKWIYLTANKVNISNRAIGVGAIIDIQDKKNLEHQMLSEKELLDVALKSITDGVIVVDEQGRISLINNAAERILEQNTPISENAELAAVLPELEVSGSIINSIFPYIREVVDRNQEDRYFEGRIKGKDNSEKILLFSVSPLMGMDKAETGDVLVIRDITRERVRKESQERIDRLEALGILAGGIAHDFNNLLTGIMGNIDLLSLHLKSSGNEKIKRWLKDARNASERAGGLTGQLLTFSKGGIPVKKAVSLAQLVEDTVSFVLSGSAASFDVTYPEDLWMIRADYNQLAQVVQNLALNALQAIGERGGAIEITLKNTLNHVDYDYPSFTLPAGSYVEIVFSDNGSGIDSESLSKIFDPYFTTKATGHGLGLATVFSIIRQHEGFISVESDVGKGTVFKIYLPADREGNAEKQYETSPPVYNPGRKETEQKYILLMDDESVVLQVLEDILDEKGFTTVSVRDGSDAVAKYKEYSAEGNPFYAAYLDLTVPGGMGGEEAAAEIVAFDPAACLVAVSGYSSDIIAVRYRDCGFSGFLKKPFLIEEVEECLKNLEC